MYICIYVHMYMYMYIYICVYICMFVYVHIYIHTYLYMYICVYHSNKELQQVGIFIGDGHNLRSGPSAAFVGIEMLKRGAVR